MSKNLFKNTESNAINSLFYQKTNFASSESFFSRIPGSTTNRIGHGRCRKNSQCYQPIFRAPNAKRACESRSKESCGLKSLDAYIQAKRKEFGLQDGERLPEHVIEKRLKKIKKVIMMIDGCELRRNGGSYWDSRLGRFVYGLGKFGKNGKNCKRGKCNGRNRNSKDGRNKKNGSRNKRNGLKNKYSSKNGKNAGSKFKSRTSAGKDGKHGSLSSSSLNNTNKRKQGENAGKFRNAFTSVSQTEKLGKSKGNVPATKDFKLKEKTKPNTLRSSHSLNGGPVNQNKFIIRTFSDHILPLPVGCKLLTLTGHVLIATSGSYLQEMGPSHSWESLAVDHKPLKLTEDPSVNLV